MNCLTGKFVIRDLRRILPFESNLKVIFSREKIQKFERPIQPIFQ